MSDRPLRVAVLGLHLESNAFAPPSDEAAFRALCYATGEEISAQARRASKLPMEIGGFYRAMDAAPGWTPVPVLVSAAEPGGPIEQGFFDATLAEIVRRLRAAGPLEGVYVSNHGGMTATGGFDPDGELYAAVRGCVGPRVPVIATVDLHANISERMVASVDALVAYRTNPHVDQAERAGEAAQLLRRFAKGAGSRRAFVRLPLVPPSVTLLTREGPYADAIRYGQTRLGGGVLNVSVVGGFAFSDTPKNGVAVVVNGEAGAPVADVALDVAERVWADRGRFVKRLTPLADAVALATRAGVDRSLAAHIYSDSGDNPGGGGGGNTTELLAALHAAGAQGVLYGVSCDPALVSAAQAAGEGGIFEAVFNRVGESRYAQRFAARAKVLRLTDGRCTGRRGIYAGRLLEIGPSCALALDGITAVVASLRKQCADPVFFEMHGLNVGAARTVVVKSRGHFRAGFDEFFPPERVLEVDTAGLTSPVLERLEFHHLPRPVFPLDRDAAWSRESAAVKVY
jgi:microcystin degradation protein MlrC